MLSETDEQLLESSALAASTQSYERRGGPLTGGRLGRFGLGPVFSSVTRTV